MIVAFYLVFLTFVKTEFGERVPEPLYAIAGSFIMFLIHSLNVLEGFPEYPNDSYSALSE